MEEKCSICSSKAPSKNHEVLKCQGWSGGQIRSETRKGHRVDRGFLFCPAHSGEEIARFIENLVKGPEAH
jgi:hypothetical protein